MTEPSAQAVQLLGRIYFIAIIPFFGGAVAPWLLGPAVQADATEFMLWSFVVLIFCSAGWLGFKIGSGERFVALQLFISLAVCASAVAAALAARAKSPFIGVTLLTFLHWVNLVWLQKTGTLHKDILKQHQRFVWTLLACHMVVLWNLIYRMQAV
jgi:hypothetical protein